MQLSVISCQYNLRRCSAGVPAWQTIRNKSRARSLLRTEKILGEADWWGKTLEKGKGCDIGYALAANSCEEVKQRGDMHRHSP